MTSSLLNFSLPYSSILTFFINLVLLIAISQALDINLDKFEKIDRPEPRSFHTSVIYKGHLIIHGGIDASNEATTPYAAPPLSDLFAVNLSNGSWYKGKFKSPKAKFHSSALSPDNRSLYVYIGGSDPSSPFKRLDLQNWEWTDKSPPGLNADSYYGTTLMSYENTFHLYGGAPINSTAGPDVFAINAMDLAYQTDTSIWRSVISINGAVHHASCISQSYKLLLVFSGLAPSGYLNQLDVVHLSVPQFDTNAVNLNPPKTDRIGATLSCIGNKAFLFGGCSREWVMEDFPISVLEIKSTANFEWKSLGTDGEHPTYSKLAGHTAIVDGTNIYIYGGINSNDLSVYKLDTSSNSWENIKPSSWTKAKQGDNNGNSISDQSPNKDSKNTIIIAIVSALFGVLMMGVIIGVGIRYWRRKNRINKNIPSTTSPSNHRPNSKVDSPSLDWPEFTGLSSARYSSYSNQPSTAPSATGPHLGSTYRGSDSNLLHPHMTSRLESRSLNEAEQHPSSNRGSLNDVSHSAPITNRLTQLSSPLDNPDTSNNYVTPPVEISNQLQPIIGQPSLGFSSSPPISTSADYNINTSPSGARSMNDSLSPLDRIALLSNNLEGARHSRQIDELSTPTSSINNWPYREMDLNSNYSQTLFSRDHQDSGASFFNLSSFSHHGQPLPLIASRIAPITGGVEIDASISKRLESRFILRTGPALQRPDIYYIHATEISTLSNVSILIYSEKLKWEKQHEMLQILEGPYVPRAKELLEVEDSSGQKNYILIQERCGLSLTDILRRQEAPLADNDVRYLSKYVGQLLNFFHARGVVISDLQPADLCFSSDSVSNRLMLPFLDSCFIEGDEYTGSKSPRYCPPEFAAFFLNNSTSWISVLPQVDMWALGCFIYELYTRKPILGSLVIEPAALAFLNQTTNDTSLPNNIKWGDDGILSLPEINQLPIDAGEAIRSLLNRAAVNRSTAAQFLESDFIISNAPQTNPSSGLIASVSALSFDTNYSTEITALAVNLRKQTVATSEFQVPRLVVIVPTANAKAKGIWQDPSKWDRDTFVLHFLCEGANSLHFTSHPGYPIIEPHLLLGQAGLLVAIVSQLCALYLGPELVNEASSDLLKNLGSSNTNGLVEYFECLAQVMEQYCVKQTSIDPAIQSAAKEMAQARRNRSSDAWLKEWIPKARTALTMTRHLALKSIRSFLQTQFDHNIDPPALPLGVLYCRTNTNSASSTAITPGANNLPKWHAWLCPTHAS